jgi:phosphate transport system permease protein
MTDVIDDPATTAMPTLRVEYAAAERDAGAAAIVPQLRTELGLDDEDALAELPRARPLHQRSVDDIASLIGSALGSLGLVWLLYERVLPLSGTLGFVLCWFVAFLVVYSTVTSISYPRPMVVDRIAQAIVTAGAVVVGFALAWTIIWIFLQGLPALIHPNFYTEDMAGVGLNDPLTKGGIKHALVGTIIQVGIATAIALPLGIGTAVYMTEVGGRLSRTVRTVVEAMTALPDILAGLFVYAVLVIALEWERSGLAAALALAVTMMPIIARSAEVVLRVVPGGLREASLALGASQWQTVRRVVLPTAKAGLATSLILGIARIAGETAPLLIVSGASTFFNPNPSSEPMNSLPLFIYDAVRRPAGLTIQARGYGAATLLLIMVLVLFVVTRFLARDKGPSR